ncbi:CpaE-like family protein [Arthrobacter flavus]
MSGRAGLALVTSSQRIRDETARVAAAAGLELTVATTLPEARQLHPAALLVGSDSAAHGSVADGELILVGLSGEDSAVWQTATRFNASQVALLPAAAGWLVERLAGLRARGPRGHVLGVMGCSGGVGASSLSCWLALAAARSGRSCLLLDGDCAGGGLDLALSESLSGIRWEDLGEVSGTLNPDQLMDALPVVSGVSVLAMGGSPATEAGILGSSAVKSVLDAVRSGFDLTIADLPSGWPWGGPLLSFCDELVLLVPGRRRPIAVAHSIVQQTQFLPVGLVARGPFGEGLDSHRVAELVGGPLTGHLPQLRGVATAERQGRLLAMGKQRPVRVLTAQALATVPFRTAEPRP